MIWGYHYFWKHPLRNCQLDDIHIIQIHSVSVPLSALPKEAPSGRTPSRFEVRYICFSVKDGLLSGEVDFKVNLFKPTRSPATNLTARIHKPLGPRLSHLSLMLSHAPIVQTAHSWVQKKKQLHPATELHTTPPKKKQKKNSSKEQPIN